MTRQFVSAPTRSASPLFQPKLALGPVNDPFEREADAMAEQVTRGNGRADSRPAPLASPILQRQLPPSVTSSVTTVTPQVESAIQQSNGGQTLPSETRAPLEQAMGFDFSKVRIHTDHHADQLNRSLTARAFTTRQDIFFREGEYQPGSSEGQKLLAHELTHVVQQTQQPQHLKIQRTVNFSTLDSLLDDPDYMPWGIDGVADVAAALRNFAETKMVADALLAREHYQITQEFVDDVNAIMPQPLTREDVDRLIDLYETNNNEEPTVSPVAPQDGDNPIEAFVKLIERRRGAYNWQGGTQGAFRDWIAGPMAHPIPKDAQINCWEAILAATVEQNLLVAEEVAQAYQAGNVGEAVFNLLGGMGMTTIQLPTDNTQNNIQRGDVIFLDGETGHSHHVVVALGANLDNFSQVPVMSLWSRLGGNSFAQILLGQILPFGITAIRYRTL